jgi:hypothetical protein
MGRVLTNNVSLAYTIETALGVAGTTWFLLEPNSINSFGAEITTVARNPISRNRQRRKGTVTDLDSAVEFEEDLTLSSFRHFIEGFCFVTGINTDVTALASTAAETTGDTYTIAALNAAQAEKFEVDTLVWAEGFSLAANNGLKVLDTDASNTDTSLAVADNLADEASPPAAARVSFAGHRIAAADTVTWTWDGGSNQATLSETGVGTLLAQLGLTAGQFVHVGSIATAGGAIQNAFENSAANDMYGWARVVSVGTDDVVFDKVDAALQFTDSTDPATAVDILFGEFIRNVPTTGVDYLERSFQFEVEFPNLDAGGGSEFQYALGNFCNTAAFSLPLTDKATITFAFIGTDTENPVVAGSRKSGASSATNPLDTGAFNTSSDIARLRITETDEDGITTDFKSLTMTLNNNVSPEKVLGQLGARYMNTGNFEVDLEAQLVFTDGAVVNKIRDNETVTMDFIVKNDDGVIAVDIPSMTLGGGGREYPVNESVLINTTGLAFQDSTLNTSIGVSILPVPLP